MSTQHFIFILIINIFNFRGDDLYPELNSIAQGEYKDSEEGY